MTRNHKILVDYLLSVGHETKDWNINHSEWSFSRSFINPYYQKCKCSHPKILEVCVIKNRINGTLVEIGSVCIKKFFPELYTLHQAQLKIINELSNNCIEVIPPNVLATFLNDNVITNDDYNYLTNNQVIHDPSGDQLIKYAMINRKIMANCYNREPEDYKLSIVQDGKNSTREKVIFEVKK